MTNLLIRLFSASITGIFGGLATHYIMIGDKENAPFAVGITLARIISTLMGNQNE